MLLFDIDFATYIKVLPNKFEWHKHLLGSLLKQTRHTLHLRRFGPANAPIYLRVDFAFDLFQLGRLWTGQFGLKWEITSFETCIMPSLQTSSAYFTPQGLVMKLRMSLREVSRGWMGGLRLGPNHP